MLVVPCPNTVDDARDVDEDNLLCPAGSLPSGINIIFLAGSAVETRKLIDAFPDESCELRGDATVVANMSQAGVLSSADDVMDVDPSVKDVLVEELL